MPRTTKRWVNPRWTDRAHDFSLRIDRYQYPPEWNFQVQFGWRFSGEDNLEEHGEMASFNFTVFTRTKLTGSLWFALILLAFVPAVAWSQSNSTIKDVTVPEIKSIEAEKADRTVAQKKVSSQILDALKQQAN